MKKHSIIIALIIVVIIVIPVGWLTKHFMHQHTVLKKCPELRKYTITLEACYGSLVIENNPSGSSSNYFVEDYRHGLYTVAGINNLKQYKVVGDTLYVIDENPPYSTVKLDNGKVESAVQTYQNSNIEFLYFDKPDDIPNYITININSGEVKRYKVIQDAPSEAQAVFQDLERK